MSKISKLELSSRITSQITGLLGAKWGRKLTNWLNPCCPFQLDKFTAAEAIVLDLTEWEGSVIYVTDTDGTFTSVGFWGAEDGAWVKL